MEPFDGSEDSSYHDIEVESVEDVEAEDDDDDTEEYLSNRAALLRAFFGRTRNPARAPEPLILPAPPPPVQGDIRHELIASTSADPPCPIDLPSLRARVRVSGEERQQGTSEDDPDRSVQAGGSDEATSPPAIPSLSLNTSPDCRKRNVEASGSDGKKRKGKSPSHPLQPTGHRDGSDDAVSPPATPNLSKQANPDRKKRHVEVYNTWSVLTTRELGGYNNKGLSLAAQRHMLCQRNLPEHPVQVVDSTDNNAYIGKYSSTGDLFYVTLKDQSIRIYDTRDNWKLRKNIEARQCRWTITDTSLSPDQRLLIYSTISPTVRLVNVGSSWDIVHSISNITEIHEELDFEPSSNNAGSSFGIWSVQWSADGREVIAGTGNESVLVYDMETNRVVARARGHDDDVNAVRFLDDSGNVIASGSDDTSIKLWDRREMALNGKKKASGVLLGHINGITYIDPRGDGRYLVSNGKDQTAKLWDIRAAIKAPTRKMYAPEARRKLAEWDYRWGHFPRPAHGYKHDHDVSVMTYRGHAVIQTLIRVHFSPQFTTGQRYIYTGNADGSVMVYDVLTGLLVTKLEYHNALVRDCSWHPFLPELTSVAWDGLVVKWDAVEPEKKLAWPPATRLPYW